jgi:hypothetical protein
MELWYQGEKILLTGEGGDFHHCHHKVPTRCELSYVECTGDDINDSTKKNPKDRKEGNKRIPR